MRTLATRLTLAAFLVITLCAQRQDRSSPAAPRLVRIANTFRPANGLAVSPVESVTLSIYRDERGGDPLWSESQNVSVDPEGRYSVLMGATLPEGLPLDLFASVETRWLGVTFNRSGEVEQPRVLLVSVPYAMKAADAETLGGLPASAYLLSPEAEKALVSGAASGGRSIFGASRPGKAVSRVTSGNAGYIAQFVNTTDLGNSLLFQSGSNVGLGTANPAFAFDLFSAAAGPSAALRIGNATTDNRMRVESTQPYALGMKNGIAGTYAWMGVTPFGHYQFSDQNGVPLVTIQQGGNLGIGTTSPASKLDVAGDINMFSSLRYQGGTLLKMSGANLATYSLAVGIGALANNATGAQNLASGPSALFANTAGSLNTAVGSQALYSNTTGVGNTAVGFSALRTSSQGSYNTAIGIQTLMNADFSTSYNTAVGAFALVENTFGYFNTAIGGEALQLNTGGLRNTAAGAFALQQNTTGNDNTASGNSALQANLTGSHNTALGSYALQLNARADNNTATGYSALSVNDLGTDNTAIGSRALQSNTSGFVNAATGAYALQSNTTGSQNTATGASALQYNISGNSNTATGYLALWASLAGDGNVADGAYALWNNVNGSGNSALGYFALGNNTIGQQNVAVGSNALMANTIGFNNIAIGYFAAANASLDSSNNIHIGNRGAPGDNKMIRIGTAGTQTSFFTAGVRGVTTGMPDAVPVMIDSAGQLGTVSSSRRFKEDIQDMAGASRGLLSLRPVTFRYRQPYADGSKPLQYGLIAEEVAEVYPDLVARSADGQIETVKYQTLNVMLLNELQKQQTEIETQRQRIRQLEERLVRLEAAAGERR